MNLKKYGKVFTSKVVGTGPSSYEKRIYRAAVSQRLRNTALDLFCGQCRPDVDCSAVPILSDSHLKAPSFTHPSETKFGVHKIHEVNTRPHGSHMRISDKTCLTLKILFPGI